MKTGLFRIKIDTPKDLTASGIANGLKHGGYSNTKVEVEQVDDPEAEETGSEERKSA